MLNKSTPLDLFLFYAKNSISNIELLNVSSTELIHIFPFGLHKNLEEFIKKSQNIFYNFDWFICIYRV